LHPEAALSDNVYKTIELTGSSHSSVEDAVRGAVAKAAETVRHLRWFEVTDTRGFIKDGQVEYWQVTIKIGFTLE
jgi:dodecin